MDTLPLISIVVPVYNTECYVIPCLESLLQQSYKNIEILVVDDASPDGAVTCIKSLNDKRIKIMHHSVNKGLSAARNTGIEAASGKYIAFVDSDDLVHPQMLEVLYTSLAQHQADFAFASREIHISSYEEYRPQMRNLPAQCNLVENPFLAHLAGKPEVHMQIGAKLYSKIALSNHRFINGIYYEDLPFNLVFLDMIQRAVHIPLGLYYYINRPGSITKSAFTLRKGQSYCAVAKFLYTYFSYDKKRLAQIRSRYINGIVKRSFKGIFNSPQKKELLEQMRPEIKEMYKNGVLSYSGLSPRSCWRLWQILHG